MSEPNFSSESDPAPAVHPSPEQGMTEGDDLESRVLALEQERDQFRDMMLRKQADFENYQKRVQRDQQQERRYCQSPLALDLLAGLDNLERAIAAAKQAGESGPLAQGVEMVQTQILDIFRRHGITPIEAMHQPFDPNLHNAVMQRPAADYPAGTVVDVVQQGFMIHDRVLRPTAVVVSTVEEPPAPETPS